MFVDNNIIETMRELTGSAAIDIFGMGMQVGLVGDQPPLPDNKR